MITDEKTDFLYLADMLPEKDPEFWRHFEPALKANQIRFDFLPETNDIWCRDYMPIQTGSNQFVQFVYQPGYLQTKKYKPTISHPKHICQKIGINTRQSEIKLEGGNLVKSERRAILTDKIYTENPQYERKALRKLIQDILEVETLTIIPRQPGDFTGHADGMLRLINEDTLLVNDFSYEKDWFQKRLKGTLNQTGLKTEPFIYKPVLQPSKENKDTAEGTYINFLQIGKVIFLPIFNKRADECAVKQIEKLFPDCKIVPVLSIEIARKGGVLNCISWNIRK